MSDLASAKRAARAAAVERRRALHEGGVGAARQAAGHALAAIAALRQVRIVAGYLPMRSEIDPLPTMRALAGLGYRVVAPVIVERGAPLAFREWRPGWATAPGPMGAPTPAAGEFLVPEAVLAPLLAFDAAGWRLGYGGGYYDRTLARLRAGGTVAAYGFGYAGQQVPNVPRGPDDARLDGIVTEAGFAPAAG